MKRTITSKPYFHLGEPQLKIKRELSSGTIKNFTSLEIETYWEDPHTGYLSIGEKLEDHWIQVPIKEISFGGYDDYNNRINYTLYGEEIDNPSYERQRQEYENAKMLYDEKMKIWEQEEAQQKEEIILAEKKKEIEIYMKLKKLYEGEQNDLK